MAVLLNAGLASPISIINTFGGQTVTDVGTLNPFNNVTIADPNIGQTETLTVTLSSAANGTLTNLGGGSYNAGSGVYTVTGTATTVTAALDGLVFKPTYYHEASPGTTVPTTLTIAVTDTAGASASDSATTITTTETALPLPIGPFRGIDYSRPSGTGGTAQFNARIDSDMTTIAKIGNIVRLYTVSNGMDYAVTSAIAHGLQVIPSAYLVDPNAPGGSAANDAEIANLIALLNKSTTDLTKIPFVDVGSDFLSNNPTQHDYLAGKIQYVQKQLPGVMVTASERASTYANTDIGNLVDVIFPTFSPFSQGGAVSVGNAKIFFQLQYGPLADKFTTKNIVVSGIGWPSSGTNGGAVGSVPNEEAFWSQFILYANQNRINYLGFEAFDSPANANTEFSGGSWGLYTAAGTPKGPVTTFSPASPPVIIGSVADQTTTDGATVSPFSGVTIGDPNDGQTETLTVTLSAAANGTLGNLGGGSYNASTGVYTVSGSAAAVTAAVDGLVFAPTAHQVAPGQTVTTTFAISDVNTLSATAVDSTTSVVATAAGPPQIQGSVAGQETTDIAAISPFHNITVLDQNGSQIETLTISLSAAANGTLSNLGGGLYNAPTGVYTVSGSAAAVTAAVDGLVFTPTAHQVAPGQTVTTTFTINDTDTAGAAAIARTFSVVATPAIVIEAASATTLDTGVTSLVQVGNQYIMGTSTGIGTTLRYNGSAVTLGQFGSTVNPIGAEALTSGGYEVAWKVTGANQYIIWYTDTNGNYLSSPTGLVSGTDPSLENLETSFKQDLNGDGTVGLATTLIESSATPLDTGVTSLVQIGNQYAMLPTGSSTGTTLRYNGSAVTLGQFGSTVNPIGAEATSGGYEVAWKVTGANQYIIWYTDTNGNYLNSPTGLVSGTDPSLESLETSFKQDLNGDGTVGFIPTQVIESFGNTGLWRVGNEYVLVAVGGSAGVLLQHQGAPVIAGQLDTWVPIGAEQTLSGFEVAWKHGTADEYIVWNTDPSGNFVSTPTNVVSGTSATLEGLEPLFQQDINGDGTIGVPTSGSGTSAQTFFISVPTATIRPSPNTASASTGLSAPSLTFIGSPNAVVLGAEATAVAYDLQPSSGIETVADFVFGKDWLQIELMGAPSSNLLAYDTSVGGVHAIAFANANDLAHGIVLLNMTGAGETAANVLGSRTSIDLVIAHIS